MSIYPVEPGDILGSAMFVGQFEHDTKEWHEARAAGIGSSDIGAVMGLPVPGRKSKYTLWHEKAGLLLPEEPDDATKQRFRMGHKLEKVTAELYAEDNPDVTVYETGSWRSVERPWQLDNPDRLVFDAFGVFKPWEGKASRYGDEFTDTPPDYYIPQCIWHMDTFGTDHCVLDALIGGFNYVHYVVEYDEFMASIYRDAAQEFMQSIDDGVAPEIDGSESTYRSLRRLNPSLDRGREVVIENDIAEMYLEATANAATADKELLRSQGHMLAHMGTAQWAIHDGKRIASRVAIKTNPPYLKKAA